MAQVRLTSAEILETELDMSQTPAASMAAKRTHVVRFVFETDDLDWARAIARELGALKSSGPEWAAPSPGASGVR